jgi:hypothetical protein
VNILKDDDEDDDDVDGDKFFDDGGAAWDPEHQPPDLNEDEAIQFVIAQCELKQLA